jgi:hypothetical protein
MWFVQIINFTLVKILMNLLKLFVKVLIHKSKILNILENFIIKKY